MENAQNPASRLLNVLLPDNWKVVAKEEQNNEKGQGYSEYYIVSNGIKKGFLKAFDYRDLRKPGGKENFDRINRKFERERDLLKKCNSLGINNIVGFITSGQYFFKEGSVDELVEYFILEYSENGNLQKCLDNSDLINLELKFEALVQIFDGLHELHKNNIMHLDLKPTNLIYFVKERLTKITDFGSARQWMGNFDEKLKIDEDTIITTRTYSPPEILYNEPYSNWTEYRKKIDLYLVGNIIVKFFTNISFTTLLKKGIHEFDDWNNKQNDGRFKQILPNLISASTEAFIIIEKKIKQINILCNNPLDKNDISLLMLMIKQLCHPDPDKRGDYKELRRKNGLDGLDRMRDRFFTLQKRTEYRFKSLYNEKL